MTIEIVPLCTLTAVLRQPYTMTKTPVGSRLIFEVESGKADGDRLQATLKGQANGDWLTIGPDGTGTLDVRALMETDDGALVYMHYAGRCDLSGGPGKPLYSAPLFETGDDRYRWLNTVQAVGKGSFDGSMLVYEVYEVR
jgi:hypothetical protein